VTLGQENPLCLFNTVALKQKFVVANADFTPDNRLYSNDGKGVALYAAIIMYLFRPNLKVELYPLYWKNGLNDF
jgi:hypothetical protein